MSRRPTSELSPLKIDVHHQAECAVVTLTGGATMEYTDQLRKTLFELADPPVRKLVIDMGRLKFISSVGLGTIVAAYVRCTRRGIGFHLAGPRAKLQEMLAITQLTRLFDICGSVEEAMRR